MSWASVSFGYSGFSADSSRVRSIVPGWSTHCSIDGQSCMFIGTVKPSGTVMYRGSKRGDGALVYFSPASHLVAADDATLVSQ